MRQLTYARAQEVKVLRINYTLADYLLAMDVQLDSLSQKYRKRDPVLARRLRRLLSLTRRQMCSHRQINYTMRRCMNRDELPWQGERAIARRNRRSYWRYRRHNREYHKLTEFVDKSTSP